MADPFEKFPLSSVRDKLIQLEDTIMRGLIERAQYKVNQRAYLTGPDGIIVQNFEGSYFDYLFRETERVQALCGRYMTFDEKPFYRGHPTPIAEREYNVPNALPGDVGRLNFTFLIKLSYLNALPSFCEPGDDGNYGDAVVRDIIILQAISQRVHYGVAVMEAKYRQDPETYNRLLEQSDEVAIRAKLRDLKVEQQVLERVRQKALKHGLEPQFIVEFYEKYVIPITIQVEVDHIFLKWESMKRQVKV
eukprot:Colp12_sorted_trinity150504_noHs@20761